MRRSMLASLFILALAIAAYPAECFSVEPGEFGYSSEEYLGGGSYLGVDTRDITPDRLGPLQLKDEQGVEVTMVDQDAPAGKAGLKEHDVILSINGEQVESVEQLRRLIREIPEGRVITIGISRAGQPMTLKAQLADRKAFTQPAGEFHLAMPPVPPMPPMPDFDMPVSIVIVHSSIRSGLMVENLTSQLADFFGVKDGHGVLVRSVEKGSNAEKAGFHAGDVITRVNGETISDAGDFNHAVHNGKDNRVSVGIIRDKKEQTLTLKLPERGEAAPLREESLGLPQISEITKEQLAKMRVELAEVRPQVELAMREFAKEKPELEKQMKEFSLNRKEIEEQVQRARQQFEQQRDQLRQQIQKSIREWRGGKADI